MPPHEHFTSYNTHEGLWTCIIRRACSGAVHGRSIGFAGAPPVFNAAKLVARPPLDLSTTVGEFDLTVTGLSPTSLLFLLFFPCPPPTPIAQPVHGDITEWFFPFGFFSSRRCYFSGFIHSDSGPFLTATTVVTIPFCGHEQPRNYVS